jgi:hypothetical protein
MARLSNWVSLLHTTYVIDVKNMANHMSEPRQAAGLSDAATGISKTMPAKMKALKIEDIKPKTTVPGAKRMRIVYGPYKLQAAGVRLMEPFEYDYY